MDRQMEEQKTYEALQEGSQGNYSRWENGTLWWTRWGNEAEKQRQSKWFEGLKSATQGKEDGGKKGDGRGRKNKGGVNEIRRKAND